MINMQWSHTVKSLTYIICRILRSEIFFLLQEQHSKMTAMLLGVSFSFIVLVIPVSILHSMATFSGFNPFMSTDHSMVTTREVITTLEQVLYLNIIHTNSAIISVYIYIFM